MAPAPRFPATGVPAPQEWIRRSEAFGSVSDTNPKLRLALAQELYGLVSKRGALRRVGANVKIGIIGAGNIGGTLTRRLAALGHVGGDHEIRGA